MDMETDAEDPASAKRKTAGQESPHSHAQSKRRRLEGTGNNFDAEASSDTAFHLPAEIWHRVFSLLPPKTLISLLVVNKLFNAFLDPSSPVRSGPGGPPRQAQAPLSPMKSDAIWQASRRLYWPLMPGPMDGRSEMDMWRLCCTRSCQFCSAAECSDGGGAQDQWHCGPGAKGVSPVFPFFIVCCGKCLSDRAVKEVNLLLSHSTPSFLLAGLPMAFLTSELHVIPPQVLSGGMGAVHPEIAKVFLLQHVKSLNAEFEAVKVLGNAAAEQWVKGLEARGKRSLADSSGWEKWYLSGGVHEMRKSLQNSQPSTQKADTASITGFHHDQDSDNTSQKAGELDTQDSEPGPEIRNATLAEPELLDAEQDSLEPLNDSGEDAANLKSSHKAGIEREEAVEAHLPLDGDGLETLKGRIRHLAQELAETSSAHALPHPFGIAASETRDPKAQSSGQVSDKESEDARSQLYARISEYADEIIEGGWKGGEHISRKEAPQFAAEVLLHVRERFYAEGTREATARETTAGSLTEPMTPKLTLENMRWVFDTKIKKHTDKQKMQNIFFCNACPRNGKPFTFQAVIQHYAAKHTKTLSLGSAVVCWKCEWPEEPIFDPDPKQRKGLGPPSRGWQKAATGPSTCADQAGHHTLPPIKANQSSSFGTSGPENGYAAAAPAGAQGFTATAPVMPPPESGAAPRPPQRQPQAPVQTLADPFFPQSSQQPLGKGPEVFTNSLEYASGAAVVGVSTSTMTHRQYTARVNYMAHVCQHIWAKIGFIKALPDAAKACVLVHHVVRRYEEKFPEQASLSIFMDGLSNHKSMRPARSIKCLHCRICKQGYGVLDEKKPSTLPQLVKHFDSQHNRRQAGETAGDWRVDMISPPDTKALQQLPKAVVTAKALFKLITDGLPLAPRARLSRDFAVDQRKPPRNGSSWPERSFQAKDAPPQLPGSMAYQFGPSDKDRSVKVEDPEYRGAAGFHHLDRPVLRPARVVYAPEDSPQLSLRGAGAYRGADRHSRSSHAVTTTLDMERLSKPTPAPPARLDEDGFEILDSLEAHLGRTHGMSGPREPPRPVVRYEMPSQTGPGWDGHGGQRGYLANRRDGPRPYPQAPQPGFARHAEDYYQASSHRLASGPAAFPPGDGYHGYRGYPEAPPPPFAQPAESYELVEVRDRRGDYLVKRPVPRGDAVFPHPGRVPEPAYPPYGPVYGDGLRQMSHPDPRRPAAAYAGPGPSSSVGREEYDPRYPAAD